MDFDLVSGMKVEELKNFLRLRGLKVTGRKQELVARAFVAIENNVEIIKTAEEIEKAIGNQYAAKLRVTISSETGIEEIPDPFKIDDGWISETEGVKLWPPTLYPDIFNFLAFHPSELASSDLADYKTTKGYSYYEEGWLKPLDFNSISNSSQLCLLRTTCRPSQKISDSPHRLWICLQKKTGRIMEAHCSCMAGMSKTCNHVAAALFRIEAAIRIGLSNPSCTSKSCEWLPNNTEVQPMKVKDLKLSRGSFGRRGKESQKKLNSSPKKRYNPIANSDMTLTLADVASALRSVCKETESMIFFGEVKEQDPAVTKNQTTNFLTFQALLETSQTAQEYIEKLDYFAINISSIEKATRGQSNNPFWFALRKHCISASKAHAILTKMATLQRKGGHVDFTAIFEKISGKCSTNPDLPALKYGRAMEAEAANHFFSLFAKEHRNAKIMECGIFLCRDLPFVGASPDRIILCDCCGKSCLEVKCPISIARTTPTDPNVKLPYLKIDDQAKHFLSRSHQYYTQCQIQMAATETNACFFYVWTSHGTFFEKLNFDKEFCDHAKELFNDFYLKKYLPYICNIDN